ncbi:hypothetical protein GS870_25045 [Rhodococcus hoagii]|nr:hypothetical protein [Prescottella equi]
MDGRPGVDDADPHRGCSHGDSDRCGRSPGGCRILAHPDGTSTSARGTLRAPRSRRIGTRLGGKVLHVDADGSPAAGNPFPDSPVFTLGHRNVQGLALQPGTGRDLRHRAGHQRDDE